MASALAREAGLHPSQLYKWRHQLCARQGAAAGFCAGADHQRNSGAPIAGASWRDVIFVNPEDATPESFISTMPNR
jgi:hypothetical protein